MLHRRPAFTTLKEEALTMQTLDALNISVLVRCVGEARSHIKGIAQVSANVFSKTYGQQGDEMEYLEDIFPFIHNVMVQAPVASKLNPRQHRALSSVTHL